MLIAYLDESGHSVDARCRFVGMGGLVAESKAWIGFTQQWQAVLDEFIDGKPFHMKEFVCKPGIGPYVDWKEPRRRAFLSALVNTILGQEIRVVGCVVSVEGFERLIPEHQRLYIDPYYMAFQEATHGCSICGLNIEDPFDPQKVAMIYAYQQAFGTVNSGSNRPDNQGRAEKLWHAMRERKTLVSNAMGSYSSDLPKNIPALQAADLFAYEITKEFENRLKRPKDDMRWALRQILAKEQRQALIKFIGFPNMLQQLMDAKLIEEDLDIRLAASMLQLDAKIDRDGRSQGNSGGSAIQAV